MSKPIAPKDVQKKKVNFPPDVFDVFNRQIQGKWDGKKAVVYQNDVLGILTDRLNLRKHEIFERNFLDIEDEYKEVGWHVEYVKAAYNNAEETSLYIFTK